MKIKYVGLKEQGSTAFADKTGIARWMRGDVHDIADADLVERMLKHPDIFAVVDAKAAPKITPAPTAAPVAPAPVQAKDSTPTAQTLAPGAAIEPAAQPVTNQDVVATLDAMDDAAVRAFAKAGGLKIQGLALFKGANLRAKVRDALSAKS